MFINYFKIAVRNLWKNIRYAGINILGLAIGIAAVILILLYLQYEWSYDRFHEKGDSLYRISVRWTWEGREDESFQFLAPVGPALKSDYPQVKEFLRVRGPFDEYFYHQNRPVRLDHILHVDSTFFDLLSFKLLRGAANTALTAPYSMVIVQSLAQRIFGTDQVIGATLQSGQGDFYTITAVAQDPPPNSSIQFQALISFSTLYQNPHMHMGWNGGNQYVTFVQLDENANPFLFEKKLPDFITKYLGDQTSVKHSLSLQPLKKIHLFYDPGYLFGQILLFGSIAVLIMVVACINFINLSMAQTVKRAREIGVRKVVGAQKKNLVAQFLIESLLSSMLATLGAILLVKILFPVYTQVIDRELSGIALDDGAHIGGLLFIAVLAGIVAGGLPALHLAGLMPVKILKNSFLSGHKKSRFRNWLLMLQFSVSILLILCTLIIYQQQAFMKNKVLGFDKNNILIVNLATDDLRAKNQILKNEVKTINSVKQASLCSEIPYRGFGANGYLPEGFNTWKLMHVVFADADFLTTFDIQLLKGRNFNPEMATDQDAYLINETLAKSLAWAEPIGRTIQRDGSHPVIGVVQDFHFATLHHRIEPLIIASRPEYGGFNYLALRISSNDLTATIEQIKQAVAKMVPAAPFEYWFLDHAFDTLYRYEERVNQLLFYFSGLAIFIALLGLYSLVSIATEYKTKEIGIRKALGSSVYGITWVISKEFLTPVLIANLVAWPLAFYAASHWLQNFAYRISIRWWMFVLAGLLALVIAVITVSIQSIRAAVANPVESLRYE